MTRAEMIHLTRRIARDVQRVGEAPFVMVGTIDDATGTGCLDLLDTETGQLHGRLYSERDYDLLLRRAYEIVWGSVARA